MREEKKKKADDRDKGHINVKMVIDKRRKPTEDYSRVGPAKKSVRLRLHEGGKGCYFCTSKATH